MDKMNPMNAMDLNKFFPGDDDAEFRSLKSSEKAVGDTLTQCCCCICNCQTKATEGVTCCCVIPIKCGITTIGVFTILLAAIGISAQFFLMLNDQVKWWYCLVNIILLVPEYIAASFFLVWFGHDTVGTRGKLSCACTMVVVSASLIAAWVIIYFVWIHEGDTVYYGWGTTEEGYIKYQKKYYIFRELAWAIIVIVAYSYFICVCNRYSTKLMLARSPEEKVLHKQETKFREIAQEALDALAKMTPEEKEKAAKKDAKKAKKAKAKKEAEKKEGEADGEAAAADGAGAEGEAA